jgi:hypothetical protein
MNVPMSCSLARSGGGKMVRIFGLCSKCILTVVFRSIKKVSSRKIEWKTFQVCPCSKRCSEIKSRPGARIVDDSRECDPVENL